MGGSVSSGGGWNSGSVRRAYRPMADINVTPFIDVMLVLLIVFMVTAPLMSAGVQVDLPKTEAGPVQDNQKPLEVSVKKDNTLYIGDEPVNRADLVKKLESVTKNDYERRVFIKADQGLSYGQVMGVLGSISKGGFKKVALVTETAPVGKR